MATECTGYAFYQMQISMMRDIFDSHDNDGSGSICAAEFIEMVGSMGMKFSRRDLMKVFEKCDADASGVITFNEFVNFFLNAPKKESISKERAKKVFEQVDENKDGILSEGECLEAMKRLGKRLNNNHMAEVMKLMDSNHDGRVTLDKFVRFMEL